VTNGEPSSDSDVGGGNETVLVVEDEPVLRDLAQVILEECGYRVLSAASGPEALDVWESKGGAIDLLLTDMVMPNGLSGVDLAEELIQRKPSLRIIFTSGYTMDEVSTSFLMKHNNARYLQKPYSRDTLALNVRQTLDQSAGPPLDAHLVAA
jgi:CheY-like chemotaxis protein